VAPGRLASVLEALTQSGNVARAGDRLVSLAAIDRGAKTLLDLLASFHQTNPLSEGLPREEARERVFARADPATFELLTDRLIAQKKIAGKDRLALAAHRVAVSGEDARVKAALVEAYRGGGLRPPDAAALAESVKAPAAIIEKMSQLLVREKTLVRVDTLLFHLDALKQLKDDVTGLKAAAKDGRATVDVAAFKDRYGLSRKFAIPLLEYLDRERVTRRTGDVRLVL
jgi:selenocysteine-specific elongation factor